MKKNWLAIGLAGLMALSMAACSTAGGTSGGASGAAAGGESGAASGGTSGGASGGTSPGSAQSSGMEKTEPKNVSVKKTDGGGIAPPKSPMRYSLGTSSSGGNFYLIGAGISTILNNALPDYFVITAEETGGSTANLTTIQSGDMELGIAMTSSLAASEEGKEDWTGGHPMDKIRGMVALYPSYMTTYSLASSDVKTFSDLNGKIVGLGSKGAAMDNVLRKAFDKMGIKPSSIYNDGHGATATALGDGQVDAAVVFAYPPFAAISELEATKDLHFIGLTPDEQAQLTQMFPFYSAATLPAGSYKGAKEDVPTVSEWNMLVCSKDVPEDYVYLMTKTLLENNPALMQIHKSLQYCIPDNCLKYNIPLHAGTVKYLEEQGIKVPDQLIPPEYKK